MEITELYQMSFGYEDAVALRRLLENISHQRMKDLGLIDVQIENIIKLIRSLPFFEDWLEERNCD